MFLSTSILVSLSHQSFQSTRPTIRKVAQLCRSQNVSVIKSYRSTDFGGAYGVMGLMGLMGSGLTFHIVPREQSEM
jgi:hypothetical protein